MGKKNPSIIITWELNTSNGVVPSRNSQDSTLGDPTFKNIKIKQFTINHVLLCQIFL